MCLITLTIMLICGVLAGMSNHEQNSLILAVLYLQSTLGEALIKSVGLTKGAVVVAV